MQEKLSTQYNDAVQQIKTAILRSQAKALAGVNRRTSERRAKRLAA